jgi:glycosyltransferase involved in cell wall biosynthesis
MDLVTITDHNTISGSLEIAHLPGTFVSEEVTTYFPEDGCKAHVLVYDIDECLHKEIFRIRENIFDLVPFLNQNGIVHTLAHPLYAVNDKLTIDHFEKFLLLFRNFELNGARDEYQNQSIRMILKTITPAVIEKLIDKHEIVPLFPNPWKKNLTGGSDDHSSLNIARQHTRVKGAANREEFLLGIETNQSEVIGEASTPQVMSHNLYGIAYQYYRRKLSLEKKVGKDLVLRFLDRSLQSDSEDDNGLVTKIYYFIKQRRALRSDENKDGDQIQQVLHHEAEKLLLKNPDLMEIIRNGTSNPGSRESNWFDFVNQVSNKVMLHFWNSLLDHFSGANFFNIFQTVGSAGALYAVLAPYFVTFSVFSSDRFFSRSTKKHFNVIDPSCPDGERPVKLAHFTDTFYEINGVALTLQHQLRLANESQKDLTVITCGDGNRPARKGVRNFNPIGLYQFSEYPDQKMFLPPLLEMLTYCYEQEFTHIHTATPGPLGLAALAISKILGIPLSGTYHTALPQYALSLTGDGGIEELVWRYTIWFYDQLRFVLVPSNSTGQELIDKGIDPSKIRAFPRGVDTDRFHPAKRDDRYLKNELGINAGIKLLYVGRISKEKNLHLLVEVYKSLMEKHKDIQFVFVGDGPYLKELQGMMEGLPAVFTGYKEGEELSAIYAGCDLFVFPSATDTFGNVVLEAQASGVPVIVTDMGGPQENLINQKTGLIVKADSADCLLKGLETLLSDRSRLKEMGKAARRYMEGRSYDRAFEDTWLMYDGKRRSFEPELAAAV